MNANGKGTRGHRPSAAGESPGLLQRLRANKRELDEKLFDRHRREDEALGAYAELEARIAALHADRQAKLSELDRQAKAIDARTGNAVNAARQRQAAVLSRLHELGRTAEEIATILQLPLKRVRNLLRAAKEAGPDHTGDAAPTPTARGDESARAQ